MINFTAIIAFIVILMVVTIGIALCCGFCSDHIETFIISIPRSLSKNIKKLRETEGKIRKMNHQKGKKWLSEVNSTMEKAHELILRKYGSSARTHISQRSCFRFGYYDSSPIKLQRQVKRLIAEGQGIVAASDVREDTSKRKQLELEQSFGLPHIQEEAITAKRTYELQPVVQVCHCMEEGNTKEDKNLERTVQHTAGIPDIKVSNTATAKELSTFSIYQISENVKKKQVTQKEIAERVDDVPNVENYETMRKTLSKVMAMLGDNGIRKIGIWGPGGVGKTALLHTLYNKLENTSSNHLTFSLVIYTSGDDLRNIQEAIAARLKLIIGKGKHTTELANQIHSKLKSEKFLLILDNVWECIDLSKIEIPKNHLGSKIVLTTRSLEVCKTMEAKAIKMDCLTNEEAWNLFNQHVGGAVDADGIRPLAETVYNECGGLPLALISVGLSMRGETDISQWRSAIEKLQNSIPVNDIILQTYNSMKLSYDSLKNDNLKSCFLYCSLFLEDYKIGISELVECWLAENLIDNNLDYVEAFSEGLELIGKLKNCSLLEDIYNGVRMNDMVRHVARWIAESESNKLKWISITENEETALHKYATKFSNATTVMIHGGIDLGAVLEKLVQNCEALRVLKIKYLPQFEVCLRDRSIKSKVLVLNDPIVIEDLPYVLSLMILDLSHSLASKLPKGIERLTDLKVLNLSYTRLKSFDADIIGKLEQLEVLDMRQSSYKWPTRKRDNQSKNATLKDLSKLVCLKVAYVQLADVRGNYQEFRWVEKLQSFLFCYGSGKGYRRQIGKVISIEFSGEEPTKIGSFILHAELFDLGNCKVNRRLLRFSTPEISSISKLKKLRLLGCSFFNESTETAPNYRILSHLQNLHLSYIHKFIRLTQVTDVLGEPSRQLRSLEIDHCGCLKYVLPLHDLHTTLPKLEKITLRKCDSLTDIFSRDPDGSHAAVPSNLRTLELDDLQQLRSLSFYEWNDQLNCLETLIVTKCPELKKLPRISSIKEVRGSVRWWSSLVWDSKEACSFMKQRFKPCGDWFYFNNGSDYET